jgi:UDP-N-acetylmuramoyl-L-alanyl-D-glutamate--2,6-diaminopimelate ligase
MGPKEFLKKIVPRFALNAYHFFLAFLGALLYGFPSRNLIVIGVTGTNGKSTVVEMCHQILRQAGHKTASVSSVRFKINENEWENNLKMTMPGRFSLQKFLRHAANAGCVYAIVEVTSEGIKQYRHKFIDFDVAVFTNLTPEHIESHGSFEKYREAKGKLFAALQSKGKHQKLKIRQQSPIQNKKISIVNLDDDSAEFFLQFPAGRYFGYRILSKKQIRKPFTPPHLEVVNGEVVQLSPIKFKVNNSEFSLNLFGEFNVYNALAAICVGLSQGVDLEIMKKALGKMEGVPGRMEIVVRQPFMVIVDYAHTPDALQKVYETIKNFQFFAVRSRLICVLGAAGGGRDKWKRPELGKVAAHSCDSIILTNEDPYDENPLSIIEDIERGLLQFQTTQSKLVCYEKILDRREAIGKALSLAKIGDVVVITGKGCEPWMCLAGGKKIPWDDREIVRELVKEQG